MKLQNYGGTVALLPPVPDERKHTELKTALRSQPNWLGSVFSPAVHSSRRQPHPLTFSASGYALHSRLPHILWSADPPAAYVLDHL